MKISPTLIVLLVELAIVLLVVIGVIAYVSYRRYRQMNTVLQIVEQRQASSEPARQEELLVALREALKDEDEDVKRKAERIVESERVFHERIIGAFRTRDRDAIVKLDEWTNDLVTPYRSLISDVVGSSEKELQQITEKLTEMEGAMAALANERDRMTEELKKKEKEVDSMVKEYVSAVREKEPARSSDADVADGAGAAGPDRELDEEIEAFKEREAVSDAATTRPDKT